MVNFLFSVKRDILLNHILLFPYMRKSTIFKNYGEKKGSIKLVLTWTYFSPRLGHIVIMVYYLGSLSIYSLNLLILNISKVL